MWKCVKYIRALAFLITMVITTGYAQSAKQSSVLMSPEASLTAPSVSPVSTEAWSDRALEKVEEWIAYLNLLREADGDTFIQNQLILFSEVYFLSSESQLVYQDEWLSIQDWLRLQADYTGTEILLSDLSWKDDWTLEGQQWRRTLGVVIAAGGEGNLAWEGDRLLTVVLSRIEKSFGPEKVVTWEVRFDGLR